MLITLPFRMFPVTSTIRNTVTVTKTKDHHKKPEYVPERASRRIGGVI